MREVRNNLKEAVLCPDGTRHQCPLGSITSFAPLEATVTQRLRIPNLSLPVRGLPPNKKTRQNTLQSGPDGHGTSGRAACRTAGERASLQRMRTGPSSDGWERQKRMVTVFTSEPLPSSCNLERVRMGLLNEQLAASGQPVSTHARRQANLQRTVTTDGPLPVADGLELERQQHLRLTTFFTTETPMTHSMRDAFDRRVKDARSSRER